MGKSQLAPGHDHHEPLDSLLKGLMYVTGRKLRPGLHRA